MDFAVPFFILAIITIRSDGWLVNNWIHANSGYAVEDDWGGTTERMDHSANAQLLEDKRRLLDRLEATEDRLAVLERIVTDSSYRLDHEIEKLRDDKGIVQ